MNRLARLMLAAAAALPGAITTPCLAEGSAAPKAKGGMHPVLIGTNQLTSVYFQVGNAICRLVGEEESKWPSGPVVQPCGTAVTGGSITNVEALRTQSVDLALVQSNVVAEAVAGAGPFKDRPDDKLRVLFSLYDEPFQLLVMRNLGIKGFEELRARKVNLGPSNSAGSQSFAELMRLHDMTEASFSKTVRLSVADQFAAFCDSNIEALGMMVGYPNAGYANAIANCGGDLLSFDAEDGRRMIEENRFFRAGTIPKATYPGVDHDVKTFGVVTVAVATADMPEETAYRIVHDVFERLDDLKAMHPALAGLDPKKMVTDGIAAPLHPGAMRYFREKDLLK